MTVSRFSEPYGRKLDLVREFTVQQNEIGREEVVDKLGQSSL